MSERIEKLVLRAGLLLVPIGLLLSITAPEVEPVLRWQRTHAFKMATGYVLLSLMLFMCLLPVLRKHFSQPRQLRMLRLSHEVGGIAIVALVLLHAPFEARNFLSLLSYALLATTAVALSMRLSSGAAHAKLRRRLFLAHVGLGLMALSLSLQHVYLVYAYYG